MSDGRRHSLGQIIPLATQVVDVKYCFQGQGGSYPEHEGLRLLSAGRERCLPGFHVNRTDFACVLVEFVVEGNGKIRTDGTISDPLPGVIFSYQMGTPHDLWAEPTDPMTNTSPRISSPGNVAKSDHAQ